MSEKYILLSKHFLGETSSEEEEEVAVFKAENPKEYIALAQVWKKDSLTIKDYDSNLALKEVMKKSKKKQPKIIPLYITLRKYAAVVAVLIFTVYIGQQLFSPSQTDSLVYETQLAATDKIVELADGSMVYLNKNASLMYPISFGKDARKVILTGEAFFEIAKDKNRPFTVATNHAEITVLGTSFNINTNTENTEIAVKTGKVKVQSAHIQQFKLLTPGYSALASTTEILAFETKKLNYLAWKDGIFKFEETPIQEIIKDLNRYYNNQISLINTSPDCVFTGSFNQQELSEVMEALVLSCNLKIRKTPANYELY